MVSAPYNKANIKKANQELWIAQAWTGASSIGVFSSLQLAMDTIEETLGKQEYINEFGHGNLYRTKDDKIVIQRAKLDDMKWA